MGRDLEPITAACRWRQCPPLNEPPAHQGPIWAILDSKPCSRVPRNCSEGALAPFTATRTRSCLSGSGLELKTLRFSAQSSAQSWLSEHNSDNLSDKCFCYIFEGYFCVSSGLKNLTFMVVSGTCWSWRFPRVFVRPVYFLCSHYKLVSLVLITSCAAHWR